MNYNSKISLISISSTLSNIIKRKRSLSEEFQWL